MYVLSAREYYCFYVKAIPKPIKAQLLCVTGLRIRIRFSKCGRIRIRNRISRFGRIWARSDHQDLHSRPFKGRIRIRFLLTLESGIRFFILDDRIRIRFFLEDRIRILLKPTRIRNPGL